MSRWCSRDGNRQLCVAGTEVMVFLVNVVL